MSNSEMNFNVAVLAKVLKKVSKDKNSIDTIPDSVFVALLSVLVPYIGECGVDTGRIKENMKTFQVINTTSNPLSVSDILNLVESKISIINDVVGQTINCLNRDNSTDGRIMLESFKNLIMRFKTVIFQYENKFGFIVMHGILAAIMISESPKAKILFPKLETKSNPTATITERIVDLLKTDRQLSTDRLFTKRF